MDATKSVDDQSPKKKSIGKPIESMPSKKSIEKPIEKPSMSPKKTLQDSHNEVAITVHSNGASNVERAVYVNETTPSNCLRVTPSVECGPSSMISPFKSPAKNIVGPVPPSEDDIDTNKEIVGPVPPPSEDDAEVNKEIGDRVPSSADGNEVNKGTLAEDHEISPTEISNAEGPPRNNGVTKAIKKGKKSVSPSSDRRSVMDDDVKNNEMNWIIPGVAAVTKAVEDCSASYDQQGMKLEAPTVCTRIMATNEIDVITSTSTSISSRRYDVGELRRYRSEPPELKIQE